MQVIVAQDGVWRAQGLGGEGGEADVLTRLHETMCSHASDAAVQLLCCMSLSVLACNNENIKQVLVAHWGPGVR